MANCIFGYQNRIDESTFETYGSWETTLPLLNLKNRLLSKVARSVDATATSTRLRFAIAKDRVVGVLAVANHNLTVDATFRYRIYSDSGYSTMVYDSGTLNVWPDMPYGYYEWEEEPFWDLSMTDEQRILSAKTLIHIQTNITNARYYQIEFFDTANPDGYVQLGRIFLGTKYQPEANMNLGASIGLETDTLIDKALGGAEFFDRRESFRVARFTLDYLNQSDSIINSDMMRISGVDAEVVFVWDNSTDIIRNRRGFLGRLRSLSQIEQPYNTRFQTTYEIKELL